MYFFPLTHSPHSASDVTLFGPNNKQAWLSLFINNFAAMDKLFLFFHSGRQANERTSIESLVESVNALYRLIFSLDLSLLNIEKKLFDYVAFFLQQQQRQAGQRKNLQRIEFLFESVNALCRSNFSLHFSVQKNCWDVQQFLCKAFVWLFSIFSYSNNNGRPAKKGI